jgi:hypothetical protein
MSHMYCSAAAATPECQGWHALSCLGHGGECTMFGAAARNASAELEYERACKPFHHSSVCKCTCDVTLRNISKIDSNRNCESLRGTQRLVSPDASLRPAAMSVNVPARVPPSIPDSS